MAVRKARSFGAPRDTPVLADAARVGHWNGCLWAARPTMLLEKLGDVIP
jgi:hypothetical protein